MNPTIAHAAIRQFVLRACPPSMNSLRDKLLAHAQLFDVIRRCDSVHVNDIALTTKRGECRVFEYQLTI
jgi:hypothetical protein